MLVLYSLLRFVLGGVGVLVRWRAAALGRTYSRATKTEHAFLRENVYKPGNSNRHDLCQTAKRNFQLGALVQTKERLEARYFAWQALAEKVGAASAALGRWKGRKLPYLFGVLDLAVTLVLLDHFEGGGAVNVPQLLQLLAKRVCL